MSPSTSAQRIRERFAERLKELGITPGPPTGRGAKIFEVLVGFLTNPASPATRDMYRSDILGFIASMAAAHRIRQLEDLADITLDDAIAYREAIASRQGRRGQTVRPETIYRKLIVLRMVYRLLRDGGLSTSEAFEQIDLPTVDTSLGRTPLPATRDIELMLGAADPATDKGLRDRLIMMMLFRFGMRVGEVARVAVEDFSLHDGIRVLRVTQKGNTQRLVPVPEDIEELLERYLARTGIQSGYLFRAMSRERLWRIKQDAGASNRPMTSRAILDMLKRYAARAGLEVNVRTHMGRVWAITEGLRRTKDLKAVQEGIGHRSGLSTLRYARTHLGLQNHLVTHLYLRPRPPKDFNGRQS